MAGAKKVVNIKNQFFMPVNHVKEYLISIHTGVVFSHFYAIASNCSLLATIGNKFLKLGPGTPEDMLFTNLGVQLDFRF